MGKNRGEILLIPVGSFQSLSNEWPDLIWILKITVETMKDFRRRLKAGPGEKLLQKGKLRQSLKFTPTGKEKTDKVQDCITN